MSDGPTLYERWWDMREPLERGVVIRRRQPIDPGIPAWMAFRPGDHPTTGGLDTDTFTEAITYATGAGGER